MKEYRVLFWYTVGGNVYIKAKNKESAEKKVKDYLDGYGVNENVLDQCIDTTHREYEILEVEKE